MYKKCFCIFLIIFALLLQNNLQSIGEVIIRDEISANNFKNLEKPQYKPLNIQDEGAEILKYKNFSIPSANNKLIEDEGIKEDFKGQNLLKPAYKYVKITDDEIKISSVNTEILSKPKHALSLIDENKENNLEIVVSPLSIIETNQFNLGELKAVNSGLDVGDKLDFVVLEDVIKNNKPFIKKNTVVNAIVGNITPSSKAGTPAELTVERFVTKDVNGNTVNLSGEITKKGITLTPLIYLLAYGGAPFSFGGSLVLLYCPGGQAKLLPTQKFKLYYEAP